MQKHNWDTIITISRNVKQRDLYAFLNIYLARLYLNFGVTEQEARWCCDFYGSTMVLFFFFFVLVMSLMWFCAPGSPSILVYAKKTGEPGDKAHTCLNCWRLPSVIKFIPLLCGIVLDPGCVVAKVYCATVIGCSIELIFDSFSYKRRERERERERGREPKHNSWTTKLN